MSLDTWANVADVLSVPIGLMGIFYIVRQLKLAQAENEKLHLRRQNEMTLNAYNSVKGDLRETIRRVRLKLDLEDMYSEFTPAHLEMIKSDKHLKNDVDKMLSVLNKFAVGVKYDVFNIDLIYDLAGHLFIETFNQFKPFIDYVREDSKHFYKEYEKFVKRLKRMSEEE